MWSIFKCMTYSGKEVYVLLENGGRVKSPKFSSKEKAQKEADRRNQK